MVVEQHILIHLKEDLDVPVYLEEPDVKPGEYVLFEKIGSSETNTLPSSVFAFQSISTSLYGASVLNRRVKEAVQNLQNYPFFGKVKLNSDYNFTDTGMKRYRYQAVYDISHY